MSGTAASTGAASRREAAAVLVAWAFGAAALVLAAGQSWGRLAAGALAPAVTYTGPALGRALGLAALAAAAAAVLVGPAGRRFLGLLAAALGAAAGAVVLVAVRDATALESAWPWVAALGAATCLVAGAVTAVRAPRWPSGGAAPSDARPTASRDVWDALDRGEDPTA